MLCYRGIQSAPGKTAAMDGVISAIIIKTKINYDGVAWEHSIINQYSFEMDDNPPSPETNISSSLKVLIVAAIIGRIFYLALPFSSFESSCRVRVFF